MRIKNRVPSFRRRRSGRTKEHMLVNGRGLANIGRVAETEIQIILGEMVRDGEIFCFHRTKKSGILDSRGVDFVVTKKGKYGLPVRKFFGVSVSLTRCRRSFEKHGVYQIHTPITENSGELYIKLRYFLF